MFENHSGLSLSLCHTHLSTVYTHTRFVLATFIGRLFKELMNTNVCARLCTVSFVRCSIYMSRPLSSCVHAQTSTRLHKCEVLIVEWFPDFCICICVMQHGVQVDALSGYQDTKIWIMQKSDMMMMTTMMITLFLCRSTEHTSSYYYMWWLLNDTSVIKPRTRP